MANTTYSDVFIKLQVVKPMFQQCNNQLSKMAFYKPKELKRTRNDFLQSDWNFGSFACRGTSEKLIIIHQNLYVIPIIGLIHFRPLFVGINTAQYFTVITWMLSRNLQHLLQKYCKALLYCSMIVGSNVITK